MPAATATSTRFRHLPVVEDGKPLGLVSIGDLVKVKLGEAAEEAQRCESISLPRRNFPH